MKNFGFATIAATALTAGALGLAAPALAAPTGGDAEDTISSLQDQGFKVVVNRQSTAPLSQANVVSIGEGPSFSHNVAASNSSSDYSVPVTTRTVYVNVR